MANSSQFNLEKYAEEANKIWHNKYEYVDYKPGSKKNGIRILPKVGILCHEHGVFWKNPTKHKKGQGCPICSMIENNKMPLTNEIIIKRAIESHKSQYDNLSYEKLDYKVNDKHVIVTCHNKFDNGEEHGDFPITVNHLMNGQGCPYCRYIKSASSKKRSLKEVLKYANKVHHGKYDYSLITKYENDKIKYPIICHEKFPNGKEHGIFMKSFNFHIHKKQGCPICSEIQRIKKRKITNEDFIKKANKIHGNKFYYDKTDVNNRDEDGKVIITCPKHGDFKQTPSNHLFGQGCPICKTSKLEQEMSIFLSENAVNYIHEKTFEWLGSKRLDFYLPDYNVAIECQGIQHFIDDHFYESLKITQERDKIKRKLCEKNGVKILYYSDLGIDYPYHVFENKEELLKEIIK